MMIVWAERAVTNLDYFKEKIRRESGIDEVAEKFYEKVINNVSKLIDRPDWVGVPVKEYPGVGYKSLYVMDYRIIFKVKGDSVYIVTFVHKRMLLDGRI